MTYAIDQTQRWWAASTRSKFLSGTVLHVSDSPDTKAWGRLYIWHLIKQWSAPVLLAGIGFTLIAVVLLLPGTSVAATQVVKPFFALLAPWVLALGIVLFILGRRQPFSVLALPVEEPAALVEGLEKLWPRMSDGQQDMLRRGMIRTFESRKDWPPYALQAALQARLDLMQERLDA